MDKQIAGLVDSVGKIDKATDTKLASLAATNAKTLQDFGVLKVDIASVKDDLGDKIDDVQELVDGLGKKLGELGDKVDEDVAAKLKEVLAKVAANTDLTKANKAALASAGKSPTCGAAFKVDNMDSSACKDTKSGSYCVPDGAADKLMVQCPPPPANITEGFACEQDKTSPCLFNITADPCVSRLMDGPGGRRPQVPSDEPLRIITL